jgi:hypothetical protein
MLRLTNSSTPAVGWTWSKLLCLHKHIKSGTSFSQFRYFLTSEPIIAQARENLITQMAVNNVYWIGGLWLHDSGTFKLPSSCVDVISNWGFKFYREGSPHPPPQGLQCIHFTTLAPIYVSHIHHMHTVTWPTVSFEGCMHVKYSVFPSASVVGTQRTAMASVVRPPFGSM